MLVQTWGILVKTFSKGTALCSVLAARAGPELMVTSSSARRQEGNTCILHHCKRSPGPSTKKAPSGCWFGSKWHWWIITIAFPCFVDSINVSQPRHNEFQSELLMDLHGHPALLPEHVQPLQLLREMLTDSFLPADTAHTLKLFWGFLDVFAPSLFSRSSPDWRSETLQCVSIWEQPTISPSVTTALPNIFFSLLVLLMPLQSLPSGILQMAQQCSAMLGHLHLWSIKKSPPSQIFLAQYDGTMRVKKTPSLLCKHGYQDIRYRRKCNCDCSLFYSLNDALSFQLPFTSRRSITQTKICKDANRF